MLIMICITFPTLCLGSETDISDNKQKVFYGFISVYWKSRTKIFRKTISIHVFLTRNLSMDP